MVFLVNIYQSSETLPYVVSTEPYENFDTAMKAAHEAYKEVLKDEYKENYKSEDLDVSISKRNIHIKGPDFCDWWTAIEVPEMSNDLMSANK